MAVDLPRARVLLVILLSICIASFTSIPVVRAATYDGTYDYAYNWYYSPAREWRTVRVSSGFIVKNGQISSNPSGLSGWVDSNGNTRFTGPCPYGGHRTVFTGTISSSGTGEGYYRCGYSGHPNPGGRWTVTRVSSPGIFSVFGDIFGSSDLGTLAIIVGGLSIAAAAVGIGSMRSRKSGKEEESFTAEKPAPSPTPQGAPSTTGSYQVSQPAPPSAVHAIPPSTIGVPPPPASPPVGITVGHPPPSTLDLQAAWALGQVTLTWQQPQFDPSVYRLQGYDVFVLQYDGTSTIPTKIPVGQRLPPGTTGGVFPVSQTSTYSTSGDTAGYVVEAVLSHTTSTGHTQYYTVSQTVYNPYPPS